MVLLICLALFQWAEYNVCEGTIFLDSLGWAKLGYVAITMLPPLGIHLIYQLSGDKRRWIPVLGYILAALFVGYFLLEADGVKAGACLGNYVIFENRDEFYPIYAGYYYGLLIIAIVYAYIQSKAAVKNIRRSLCSLMIGYILVYGADNVCQYRRSVDDFWHSVDYVRFRSAASGNFSRQGLTRIL